ncbi:MAG: dihydropteroate synthase [Archaeoglobales archaeon]|nr:dihydropteroate synthase [Archaeoglobales archaeon]
MKFAGIELNEPKIMGVINVSPESFYRGSVARDEDELLDVALKMVDAGASFIDVGARSTAPYLQNQISEDEEKRRAFWAVSILKSSVKVPISIDTTRATVAEAAIKAGAMIVNDVTGFKNDPRMPKVVKDYDCSAILCAHGNILDNVDPLTQVSSCIEESIKIAKKFEVDEEKIAIDPAIGFFRPSWMPWYEWDSKIIANLLFLKQKFSYPLLIGVSRKSFIGAILKKEDPAERLYGSLAATSIAVFNGADIIRTHDIKETLEVVKVSSYIKAHRRI